MNGVDTEMLQRALAFRDAAREATKKADQRNAFEEAVSRSLEAEIKRDESMDRVLVAFPRRRVGERPRASDPHPLDRQEDHRDPVGALKKRVGDWHRASANYSK